MAYQKEAEWPIYCDKLSPNQEGNSPLIHFTFLITEI